MSQWWQKRSRRVWLALGYALAGDGGVTLCALLLCGLGLWNPAALSAPASLPGLIGVGVVATGLFVFTGYVLAGWALEPVREAIELARRFSSQPGGRQISVDNPHDELGELETFLNGLLRRLEGSFVELDRLAADVSPVASKRPMRCASAMAPAGSEKLCRRRWPAL